MRTRFILSALLICLLLTAQLQARVLLKMPVYVPLNLVGLGTTVVDLARDVEAASDGEIRMKTRDNLSAFRPDYETWNRWAFLPRPGTKRIQEKGYTIYFERKSLRQFCTGARWHPGAFITV